MINQQTNEKIFDLLIADALADVWDMELAKYADSGQMEKHKFSDEFERNIRKIRNSIGRKERMKNAGRFSLKFFVTIATIMGIAFGGLLTQPKVYAAVQDVFKTIFSTHDNYTYQGKSNKDIFDKNKQLGYIPDGYELRTGFYSTYNIFLTYESSDKKYIYFSYGTAEGLSLSVDNENILYSEIVHDDIKYYCYETYDLEYDSNVILWYSDGYYYEIDAQLPLDEILKIAENLV